ncbi:MAG: hypothetical protein FWH27_00535 [Planctomycetaceae bacterium]|nr:hypothetical protein [Planctomycetaceae bacterium]
MDASLNLAPAAQHWVNLILIWLGFGAIVAIVVRSLLPGREPSGMISMLLIGVVGTCVGPLIVSTVWRIEQFNPISPVGFLASFVCSFLFLLLYQVGMAMSKRRRHLRD